MGNKGISKELIKHWYYKMLLIRRFEEMINEKFLAGDIPGFVHLYIGEEATGVGVCSTLRKSDYITSTHRGHGHTIAKGADVKRCMAELYGKRTGYCKGKGGSMHIADFGIGMLGANGVVGGGFNLAVGAALAIQLRKNDDGVAVCFFGDGASNRGTFHEGLNMASVWNLPVIFVCENNQWASTTPLHEATAVTDISVRSISYAMPSEMVDGNDVFAVYEAAVKAVDRARRGEGPTLIECKTYRVKGHFVGDPEQYRTREEVMAQMESNDPLKKFLERVLGENLLDEIQLKEIEEQVAVDIEEAVKFAEESPFPKPEEAFEDLYVEEVMSHA
ncbi:acetoin:2,6-dichlorophenolindophenol oxidoreductase subunit alpha [Heyndrickxia shackletonii]|uniref:Acetoin:2,6-dichlorophenolindophenol oxidoreductase subunit alpha n=1 Tax=Heyndrickxia shackletonii TaxID=157838 RepID=A0A0Q3TFG7_9BACI|nr:thiamine pyrophosphate-dependent dehydrogenase E1 component subunit alpha [Heyndrickxia shackletonii]KQL52790.1 acetoin:2,6-dichlorophenolindophenol oxidoreductase subunit alpha [Heyndrickxia shackletonii]NEZ00076.1 thiamine pyrophosphate-dependent dehydrogenase E1 component subunit alpha [Heyndrickxia shackletonii]